MGLGLTGGVLVRATVIIVEVGKPLFLSLTIPTSQLSGFQAEIACCAEALVVKVQPAKATRAFFVTSRWAVGQQ